MDGRMVVPHVINPTNLPPGFVETTHYTEVKEVPIDPDGVEHDYRRHEPGAVARRDGSRRRIFRASTSRARRDRRRLFRWPCARSIRTTLISRRTDGLWDSRRGAIRTSLSACSSKGGEHGKLAARLATQVIKAYVDKQQRQPTKMAAGSRENSSERLWTDPGDAEGAQGRMETICMRGASWSIWRASGLR
jgi:hypothetical protein